ncbi:MAG: hypothetical protein V4510_12955 [bacterium]
MAYKKKSVTITCASNAGSGSIALGATYARICGIRGYGGSGTVDITLTDADGIDFLVGTTLDVLGTLTGNNVLGVATTVQPFAPDSMLQTGATATDQSGGAVVVKSPVTVTLATASGATDSITVELMVEV